MATTSALSSRATTHDATTRGTTNRCTGSMPKTSIASISLADGPGTQVRANGGGTGTRDDQHGHQRADLRTEPSAAPPRQVGRAELDEQDVEGEDHQHCEGQRDQDGREQGHRDQEPGLVQRPRQ